MKHLWSIYLQCNMYISGRIENKNKSLALCTCPPLLLSVVFTQMYSKSFLYTPHTVAGSTLTPTLSSPSWWKTLFTHKLTHLVPVCKINTSLPRTESPISTMVSSLLVWYADMLPSCFPSRLNWGMTYRHWLNVTNDQFLFNRLYIFPVLYEDKVTHQKYN